MSIASRLLRPAWLEIDLDAAAENLRSVRRLVGAERKIFAVLKADGYGFGAREMAEVFVAHGADALAFADLTDAVWARRQGVSLPILVFPNSLPAAAAHVIAHRLIPTITDLDEAHAYSAAAREPIEVFVKVDAGLERLGVPAEQAVKVITAIAELPGLRLGGVCTHLHPAGADPAYIDWQFGRFTSVLDGLAAAGVEVPVKLAASSPLVMQHRHTYLNAVDPGSMLYGLPSSFGTAPAVPLAARPPRAQGLPHPREGPAAARALRRRGAIPRPRADAARHHSAGDGGWHGRASTTGASSCAVARCPSWPVPRSSTRGSISRRFPTRASATRSS